MRRITTLAVLILAWAGSVGASADEFTDRLNQERATRGLRSVAVFDAGSAVSAQNNASQRAWGLGHFATGGYAQCSAVGVGNVEHALSMWTRSPAHAAILFSPYVSAVGFHWDGWAATASVWQGPVYTQTAYVQEQPTKATPQAVPPAPSKQPPPPSKQAPPAIVPPTPSKQGPVVYSTPQYIPAPQPPPGNYPIAIPIRPVCYSYCPPVYYEATWPVQALCLPPHHWSPCGAGRWKFKMRFHSWCCR